MFSVDDETLINLIQVVSLVLISIQSLPQINAIYKGKEKVVKNLSLGSWISKTLFSLFFVASLFAGETTLVIVLTQVINLTMSAIIMGQIAYYSHIEIVPHGNKLIDLMNELQPEPIEEDVEIEYNIPVLHNLLKQIYVIVNFNLMPRMSLY